MYLKKTYFYLEIYINKNLNLVCLKMKLKGFI